LSIIIDDTTLLCQIHENLKDPLVIGIQGQLTNHQVQDFSNDHVKFEFQDGLLYHDGFLYVPDGPVRIQVFKTKHDVFTTNHLKFNMTMELMS
jgi:hypothetical protein